MSSGPLCVVAVRRPGAPARRHRPRHRNRCTRPRLALGIRVVAPHGPLRRPRLTAQMTTTNSQRARRSSRPARFRSPALRTPTSARQMLDNLFAHLASSHDSPSLRRLAGRGRSRRLRHRCTPGRRASTRPRRRRRRPQCVRGCTGTRGCRAASPRRSTGLLLPSGDNARSRGSPASVSGRFPRDAETAGRRAERLRTPTVLRQAKRWANPRRARGLSRFRPSQGLVGRTRRAARDVVPLRESSLGTLTRVGVPRSRARPDTLIYADLSGRPLEAGRRDDHRCRAAPRPSRAPDDELAHAPRLGRGQKRGPARRFRTARARAARAPRRAARCCTSGSRATCAARSRIHAPGPELCSRAPAYLGGVCLAKSPCRHVESPSAWNGVRGG